VCLPLVCLGIILVGPIITTSIQIDKAYGKEQTALGYVNVASQVSLPASTPSTKQLINQVAQQPIVVNPGTHKAQITLTLQQLATQITRTGGSANAKQIINQIAAQVARNPKSP